MCDINKTVCFTGHRPSKIGGYSGQEAIRIQKWIFKVLLNNIITAITVGIDTFISGGAQGVDQIGARAVIQARKIRNAHEQSPIRLIIARPFPSQHIKWPESAQKEFFDILNQADEVIDVSQDPYSAAKMMARNTWMVDRSKIVFAVYDGSGGGTGNCVDYASKQNKQILHINPKTFTVGWLNQRKER